MSSLFWAVYDEEQKKKSEEILATFDKDSKDEMGLMGITMFLSSLMFPGTSVLHTRLRYIYLVGWIFLEAFKSKKKFSRELLHGKEKKLREILQKAKKNNKNDFMGILGSTKIIDDDGDGEELSQPPFSVYFNLLKEWDIIKDKNISIIDIDKESFCNEYIEIIENENFKNNTFKLTNTEKAYIVKKIPPSILHTIFKTNITLAEKQHFIDFNINLIKKNNEQKILFENAQKFSILMWGTMLYYNYYLGNESDELKEKFDTWRNRVEPIVKSTWKPSDNILTLVKEKDNSFGNSSNSGYNNILTLVKDKVNSLQINFINQWYEYIKKEYKNLELENPKKIDNKSIKEFLRNREQQLKGNRARLLKQQKGEILQEAKFGINPIEYRWSNIVRFKKDFDATN